MPDRVFMLHMFLLLFFLMSLRFFVLILPQRVPNGLDDIFIFLSFPRQIPNPPIAVPVHCRRNTFQILVGIQRKQYNDRRSFP